MKSHDVRVDHLKNKADDLSKMKMKPKSIGKVQFDLNAFNERWNSIYQKIGEFQFSKNLLLISCFVFYPLRYSFYKAISKGIKQKFNFF